MKIESKIFALVLASILIGSIAATNLQQASAFVIDWKDFKKLTHEFEKNVIKSIGDPNEGPQPHLRELLQAYSQGVQRIFIGDPNIDQVRTLLQSYEQDVITLFDTQEPIPGNQFVKEFRSLTHHFEKAVIGAVSPPEPDKQ
jgi:hypothetical protein